MTANPLLPPHSTHAGFGSVGSNTGTCEDTNASAATDLRSKLISEAVELSFSLIRPTVRACWLGLQHEIDLINASGRFSVEIVCPSYSTLCRRVKAARGDRAPWLGRAPTINMKIERFFSALFANEPFTIQFADMPLAADHGLSLAKPQ